MSRVFLGITPAASSVAQAGSKLNATCGCCHSFHLTSILTGNCQPIRKVANDNRLKKGCGTCSSNTTYSAGTYDFINLTKIFEFWLIFLIATLLITCYTSDIFFSDDRVN